MDQPLKDRRRDTRFANPPLGSTRAMLRPGCAVTLIDVSAGGALVEAARPLRPGARVHFQLVTDARTYALAAHVTRCAVWSLHPQTGVTYRGALKFEHRCELRWEHATLAGLVVGTHAKSTPDGSVKPTPAVVSPPGRGMTRSR